ncbi:MAG: hypothetical protein II563_08535 [Treponema sp.]|nr:hypothetical protein [Treponema sp.]
MKKFLGKIGAVLLASALVVGITSCGKRFDSPAGAAYKFSEATMSGTKYTVKGNSLTLESNGQTGTITKNGDTYTATVNGTTTAANPSQINMYNSFVNTTLTFANSGNTVTATSGSSSSGLSGTYAVSGDSISVTLSGNTSTGRTNDAWVTIVFTQGNDTQIYERQ